MVWVMGWHRLISCTVGCSNKSWVWYYVIFYWSNFWVRFLCVAESQINKANLRDLIAVTGLVISNWIQIVKFSARVTVKFDGWPRKTIGHFFDTTSSFAHHFKSIGEFKLDLQSRNRQFESKLAIFYPVWLWNLMDDIGKQWGTSSMLRQALCSNS